MRMLYRLFIGGGHGQHEEKLHRSRTCDDGGDYLLSGSAPFARLGLVVQANKKPILDGEIFKTIR